MSRSEERDLVELFSGTPSTSWSDDECDDCGRTLGDVVRGDESVGTTLAVRGKGFELSATISLCDIARDRKKLRRILRRFACYLVGWAFREGAQIGEVSRSSELERSGGYATATVTVAFCGVRPTEALRKKLALKLSDWGAGPVTHDPSLPVDSP
jgi:hypothetical protein